MSSAIAEKMPKDKLESVFKEASTLIFHKEMLPSFLNFNLSPACAKQLSGAMHCANWSSGMAELYFRSKAYRGYISQVWDLSITGLNGNVDTANLGEWSNPLTEGTLLKARDFLLKNPDSSKWLSLIHFCMSRALSTTARNSFDSNEWSESSMFSMQLDRSFSMGECKVFGRLITKELPKYFSSDAIAIKLGENVGIGLVHMVALNAEADFFRGMDPVSFH